MRNKSFTLIELLVVIVIIGILAGVIIVSTSSSINKANIAKVKVFENSIQNELGANMVSRWKLDEIVGTTTTPDAWGSNTGTLGDGVTTSTYPALKTEAECVTDKCMYFNRYNYISIPDKPGFNFGGEMSAFIWLKGNNSTADQGILGQYNGGTPKQRSWMISTQSSYPGKLLIHLSPNGIDNLKVYYSTSDIIDNQWHLVGFTWNKGMLKLYVDGKEDVVVKSSDGAMTTLFNSSSNICIGCWFWENNPVAYFDGLFDDARIYNATLSTSQIKQNYIAGLNSLLASGSISKEEYDQRLNNLASK